MSGAQQKWGCERDGQRFVVPHAEEAWIELKTADGRLWKLPLLEISRSGLAFGLDGGPGEPRDGAEITDVKVRVGDVEFRVDLLVSHVTSGFSTGSVCGARLHTRTGPDQFALIDLLEKLAAR